MSTPDSPPSALEVRGQSMGITFRRGRTWTSNSHLALEAQEYVDEHQHEGASPFAFHYAMFKAYFDDLEDIGTVDSVVAIAERAGIPGGELREALESGQYRDQVDEGIRWSREIGVTGVPTFIFDERVGLVGAQDQSVFEQVMQELGKPPRAV